MNRDDAKKVLPPWPETDRRWKEQAVTERMTLWDMRDLYDELLKSAAKLQAERQWTPVGERKMEEGVTVLACDADGYVDTAHWWKSGHDLAQGWAYDADGEDFMGVVKWMEMPKA